MIASLRSLKKGKEDRNLKGKETAFKMKLYLYNAHKLAEETLEVDKKLNLYRITQSL